MVKLDRALLLPNWNLPFFPLITQKKGLLQPQLLLQIISSRSFYLDLYLKASNSNFFNSLQANTTTDLVVETPTSVVVSFLSYPQLLY